MKYGEDKIIPHPYMKDKRCIVRKIKCQCGCHRPNSAIMHFMACCQGGYHYHLEIIE